MGSSWEHSANYFAGLAETMIDELEGFAWSGARPVEPGSLRADADAEEDRWADDARPDPIEATFGYGEMYLAAARDHLRAAVWVVRNPTGGIYASFVLARCSIEAAAYGAWLLDPRSSCASG